MNGKIGQEEAIAMIAQNGLLGPVWKCLITGEFTPAPKTEVGKNEKVIGKLSLLEKAVMTARNQTFNTYIKMVCEDLGKGSNPIFWKYGTLEETFDALNTMFWTLIRVRLGESTYQGDGIGIRTGYQIVYYTEECECGDCGKTSNETILDLMKELFS